MCMWAIVVHVAVLTISEKRAVGKMGFRNIAMEPEITGETFVYYSSAEVFYIQNSRVISLSLPSAVDEKINGNLIWPEDLFTTLAAQSSTLQQHNFAPVATSDLTVCITVLSLSLALPHPPCSLRVTPLYIIEARPLYCNKSVEAWYICYGFLLNTKTQHTVTMARALCPGASYHE